MYCFYMAKLLSTPNFKVIEHRIIDNKAYWVAVCACNIENLFEVTSMTRLKRLCKNEICSIMNLPINIIGNKYGELTVENISFNKKSRFYYKCRCSCGELINVDLYRLQSGHTRSCNCIKENNLAGLTFGFLHVIKKLNKKTAYGYYYLCHCKRCDSEKEILGAELTRTNNPRITCGCFTENKTKEDYLKIKELGFEWIEEENVPKHVNCKTLWKCLKSNHIFQTSYSNIGRHGNCPECIIETHENGFRKSNIQVKLRNLIGTGIINFKVGRFCLDIAIQNEKIGIEYDSYYWHRRKKNTEDRERKKDEFIRKNGWKILRVRSDSKLPTKQQIDTAITALKNGSQYIELVLDDWKPRPKTFE